MHRAIVHVLLTSSMMYFKGAVGYIYIGYIMSYTVIYNTRILLLLLRMCMCKYFSVETVLHGRSKFLAKLEYH